VQATVVGSDKEHLGKQGAVPPRGESLQNAVMLSRRSRFSQLACRSVEKIVYLI
jgi:hypothetical protein